MCTNCGVIPGDRDPARVVRTASRQSELLTGALPSIEYAQYVRKASPKEMMAVENSLCVERHHVLDARYVGDGARNVGRRERIISQRFDRR